VASVWPPISEVFSGAPEKALCQAQRTFFLLPAEMFLFPGSFSTAPGSPDRRQSEPTSLYETGLKIPWWRHRAGSTPASGTKNKGRPSGRLLFLIMIYAGVEGCGSELGASGTQEPHPDQARRRESTPASGTKNKGRPSGRLLFLFMIYAGVEGCGSELGASGTQEPHPDQARRRESTPASGTSERP